MNITTFKIIISRTIIFDITMSKCQQIHVIRESYKILFK